MRTNYLLLMFFLTEGFSSSQLSAYVPVSSTQLVNKLMKMADDLAESYIHTGPELLADAIRMVGGQGALARATGYSQHGIWWALNHRHISAPFAAMVELATGGQIRREDVCTEPWVFAGLLRPKDHGAVQQALQQATRKPETD